ncbi:MAG TPA: 16S rRNA (cytosine(1402)-N(4))-methyltransferase RsmH [Ktedonobacteraceae bacterium]|jgi:16S rRNA (cytosine1402-N4)-methyltransferase|nr:16S rRNA (cytosine(1402)-N(4))-methyltransferase RsmH [Ktedonobacteraceae bacterium]
METQKLGHVPVMLEEVLKQLQPTPGTDFIDCTLGGGGHTEAILKLTAPDGRVLGIDKDARALARVEDRLSEQVNSGRLVLVHGNYAELARFAHEAGFVFPQGVLLDLGFSSYQMDDPARGFSFSANGPLDMRLDQSQELTAADIVNNASEQELADIFWRYGEEPRARPIAWRITRERAKGPIATTAQLAKLASIGVPHRPGMIHPATRVFQALRIAVNSELENLEKALPQILDVLSVGGEDRESGGKVGGRMVVISFHSLEDRRVKEFMRREAKDCICPPDLPVCMCGHRARLRILTTKPLTPTQQEIVANPRARSAKLRAAEAIIGS